MRHQGNDESNYNDVGIQHLARDVVLFVIESTHGVSGYYFAEQNKDLSIIITFSMATLSTNQ
jgi:hypothetical protein